MVYDILILLIIILIFLGVIIDLQELVINMVYGILIILILISIILGFFLDISDFDDNNEKYQEDKILSDWTTLFICLIFWGFVFLWKELKR